MEVGLTAKQIRKLSKGGYSDKQIGNVWETVQVSGDKWWSNGEIVFFESVPANVQVREVDPITIVERAKLFARMIKNCRYEVYPVEIAPCVDGKKRALRFENGLGDSVFIDARYIASILATKRVGKKRDPGVRWYTDSLGETLLAVNGRRVGLVCGLRKPAIAEAPEWNFRYTGELPS